MGNRLDIKTGDRYNRLTIIREVEPQIIKNFGRIRRRFECKCDCGNIYFGRSDHLMARKVLTCGCSNRKKRGHRTPVGQSSFVKIYCNYKSSAKKRNLSFELSQEE